MANDNRDAMLANVKVVTSKIKMGEERWNEAMITF